MAPARLRTSSESTDEFDRSEATALLENNNEDTDVEFAEEKPKYPKSVFFIVSNEFCERFSYYGMRTILVIYLRNILHYSDDDATVIYHAFTMLCYFFPIFGAMLADSLLGKFRTIFYISIIYATGNVVVSLASANEAIDVPGRELTIVGLLLIAIGTGGIKPCVSAFGGDQFKLPQQEKQLQQFFSLFYFSVNSGSLISTFLTPVLREDVKCLDEDSCYPLAFGVPAVLMIVSIFIFVFGKGMYIIKKPEGNVVLKVGKCIGHAVARKMKSKEKREHWLDHADDEYDRTLIDDIKACLRVLFLYLPLPFFWALFDQQGSRWTFQATRMKGDLGGWSLKADQMQVINPLLILAFIPLFETVMYPIFAKCNFLVRPLQRLGVGGILAAIAFVISAVVELQLEDTYAVLPQAGEAQLRVYNGFNCPINIKSDIPGGDDVTIPALEFWKPDTISVSDRSSFKMMSKLQEGCTIDYSELPEKSIELFEYKAASYFVTHNANHSGLDVVRASDSDGIDKSETGEPLIRVVFNFYDNTRNRTVTFKEVDGTKNVEVILIAGEYATENVELLSSTFKISLDNNRDLAEVKLEQGGVYSFTIQEDVGDQYNVKLLTTTEPNSIHMLWLIPQYFVLTMGEVMFSITGLEFSFTQSPGSMKSVLQACWLLTVAFGNLIVVIVAEAKFFDSQTYEFLLFAGLMFVDMIVFTFMAMRYKYVETYVSGEDRDEESRSNGLALKEANISEKNGLDNATFKGD